jgi:DNA-binding transcriptional MerR regulator
MQNSLRQLDLFGFPIETPVQPKKKEKVVKTAHVETPQPVETKIIQEEPVGVEKKEPVIVAATNNTSTPSIKKNIGVKQVSKRGRKSFKEMDTEADLIEVPDDEVLQQKLYYSISEVAGWFKVNTSLLRYWENEFDILQPRKTRKGDRLFRVEDVKNLQLIYFLLRQRKFSIDGAKNYLKNNKQEADTQARLVESLTKFRSFLLELKANILA